MGNHAAIEKTVYRRVIRDEREKHLAERIKTIVEKTEGQGNKYIGLVGAKHVYSLQVMLGLR